MGKCMMQKDGQVDNGSDYGTKKRQVLVPGSSIRQELITKESIKS